MTTTTTIPVVTIDGPSGVGKGTIARLLASHLQWHFLDSGSLYRVLALWVLEKKIDVQDHVAIEQAANELPVVFQSDALNQIKVMLDHVDVTQMIREERCGEMASKIAVLPAVRQALLGRQQAFRQLPGLVADGRDMGTVVFPDAILKIYLTASAKTRAKRRFNELKKVDSNVSLAAILDELVLRDMRDTNRLVAPLKPAPDALSIDTSHLSINDVFQQVLALFVSRFGKYKGAPGKI